MNFFLISSCEKIFENSIFFHFHGYYGGNQIKEVEIFTPLTEVGSFEVRSVYKVLARSLKIEGNTLIGELVKFSKINC